VRGREKGIDFTETEFNFEINKEKYKEFMEAIRKICTITYEGKIYDYDYFKDWNKLRKHYLF
jgi:hypothetical protein